MSLYILTLSLFAIISLLAAITHRLARQKQVSLSLSSSQGDSLLQQKGGKGDAENRFKEFQKVYLIVFGLAFAADWFQGPYVYALYESYGYDREAIGELFVAGFSSSMILGTFVGALADRWGRKRASLLYCVLYTLSCATKHSRNYSTLMVGRVLGGVATSLLFTAFEAWMVERHRECEFEEEWMRDTFSLSTLLNSLVAVGAGIVASFVADQFGYVAPFDASAVLLVLCGLYVAQNWTENYGEKPTDAAASSSSSWVKAFHALKNDPKIVFLGLSQSFFEGSMYVFVFMWTPALADTAQGETLRHGWVFALFMVAVMVGSNLFKIFSDQYRIPVDKFLLYVYGISAVSLAFPLYFDSYLMRMVGFVIFEVCVGVFWPAIGTLRGQLIPENVRATVMNIYRIPLNVLVVLILTKGNLSGAFPFSYCVLWLIISLAAQYFLRHLISSSSKEVVLENGNLEAL